MKLAFQYTKRTSKESQMLSVLTKATHFHFQDDAEEAYGAGSQMCLWSILISMFLKQKLRE